MIKLLVDFLNLLQIGKQLAHDRTVRQGKQLRILHQFFKVPFGSRENESEILELKTGNFLKREKGGL